LLETALQLRRVVVYDIGSPMLIPDPRVAFRLNPAYPGHDARGWRNRYPFARAEIVVLGDSQTYGQLVSLDDAWPQQLGGLIGRTSLQMAAGGFAPAHYVALVDEVLSHSPKAVIAAYYFGNDLWGAYEFVYRRGTFRRTAADPTIDSMVSRDPEVVAGVERAERIDPDLLRASYLNCQTPQWVPDSRLQIVHRVLDAPPLEPLTHPGGVLEVLMRHSALAVAVRRGLLSAAHGHALGYGPPFCVRYHDDAMTTVFAPGYRLVALDETDPRIVEGERISLLAFQYLDERVRRTGSRLYVVLIPTKEAAYRSRVQQSLGAEPILASLWQAEDRARNSAFEFLHRNDISMIDTLPALEAAIAKGVNPYRDDADGHPVDAGNTAIAEAVAQRLGADGFAWKN
jgi:hypothetical protein